MAGSAIFDQKNKRRVELLTKKVRGGLTAEEDAELRELTAWVSVETHKLHPDWVNSVYDQIGAAADRSSALLVRIYAKLSEEARADLTPEQRAQCEALMKEAEKK